MGQTKIKRGLDLPITGEPENKVVQGNDVSTVALLGDDYLGMKPTMLVREGDKVKLGQAVFTDKKMPSVVYTAPGSGTVVDVHRGEKRAFKTLVIKLDGSDDAESFTKYNESELAGLDREAVKKLMLSSGSWPSLRQRPFSKVANPDDVPHAIFVTVADTNPLAPDLNLIMDGQENYFKNGVTVLSKLTDGKVHICKGEGVNLPNLDAPSVAVEEFVGKHPAGNVGTHIHFLSPVGRQKFVWYIGVQDVIALGHLFTTGKLYTGRIVALAGPSVNNPVHVRTRFGANLNELTAGLLADGDNRIISGSVFSGYTVSEKICYLSRFSQQVTVLKEGREKEFIGWLAPGFNKYSIKNLVFSKLIPGKKFALDTALNGGKRAIVPIGNYEKVMPLDIIPTYLLRALAVADVEDAEKLGALELDEEDLALCTFVCQSKLDYGSMLRENLTIIEKEG